MSTITWTRPMSDRIRARLIHEIADLDFRFDLWADLGANSEILAPIADAYWAKLEELQSRPWENRGREQSDAARAAQGVTG